MYPRHDKDSANWVDHAMQCKSTLSTSLNKAQSVPGCLSRWRMSRCKLGVGIMSESMHLHITLGTIRKLRVHR